MKNGLYANIHAKRERIKAGSGEKMRKPGTKGAPSAAAFKAAAKTAKLNYRDWETDRKSTRLNSSHLKLSRMPSSA